MIVEAPTVRRVLGNLSRTQLEKVRSYAETGRFSHSWYWHGPEGNAGMDYKTLEIDSGDLFAATRSCALAVAFDVERSSEPGHFWGAKANKNLMDAMAHLSKAAGGDTGTVNYILELSELSHDELVSVVDDSLSGQGMPDDNMMPNRVHDETLTFVDRETPSPKSMNQVPTIKKVLSALSNKQLGRLLEHSIHKPFHHGWYWFGPEGDVGVASVEERFAAEGIGDPIAVAFELTPSRDVTSWRGCKLDEKMSEALEFWAKHTGGEVGMEDYVVELNSLSSEELDKLIRSVAAEALLQ